MIPNPAEPEPKQKRGVSRQDAKMPRVQDFEGDSSSIQAGHAMPLPISRPTAKKQSRKGTTIRGLFFLASDSSLFLRNFESLRLGVNLFFLASNSSLFLRNFETLRLGVNLFFQNHCPLFTACPAFQRGALLPPIPPIRRVSYGVPRIPRIQNSELMEFTEFKVNIK